MSGGPEGSWSPHPLCLTARVGDLFRSVLCVLIGAGSVCAAEIPDVENLALCQTSWLDWKAGDPSRLDRFIAEFRSNYTPYENDGSFTPMAQTSIIGLKVERVFPQSVGMALGFSVLVDAPFEDVRRVVKGKLGVELRNCESGEGMTGCALPLGPQRTLTLTSGDGPGDSKSLIGCFYFYEK